MGGFLGSFHINLSWSFAIALPLFSAVSFSSDTLNSTQSLGINQTLVSSNQMFELGFFNSTSSRWYLGIWYKNIHPRTIVWVANRDTPLENSTATLKIGDRANLVLLDPAGNHLWNSNQSQSAPSNPVLKLLDSGNLVIKEAAGTDEATNFLWKSFDFPTDTLLPGMKLGWDLAKGIEWRMKSWRSEDDPSSGDHYLRLEPHGIPQTFWYNREVKAFRSGPWNGKSFSGIKVLSSEAFLQDTLVQDSDGVYLTLPSVFNLNQSHLLTRLVLSWTGDLQRFVRTQESQSWNMVWSAPQGLCSKYSQCGPYGICDANAFPVCKCFQGFTPKNQNEWDQIVFTKGCARRTGLDCPTDKFLQLQHVELPDTMNVSVNNSMSLSECEDMCRINCSCSAYANEKITNGGTGCVIWTEELKDMRQFSGGGQDLFVRVAASVVPDSGSESSSSKKKNTGMIIGITVAAIIIVVGSIMFILWKRKSQNIPNISEQIGASRASPNILLISRNTEQSEDTNMGDLELPLFGFHTIKMATGNFSEANKLGGGGFGTVYRGRLVEGYDIAVKRLSKSSSQGIKEFKNEAKLIVKLQHQNLVRMLGCCIEKEEKMLVYEYMENNSLDFFLFDRKNNSLLDWQLRFNIICGIARGLLYLHQDSRLRIIHRDLKASNILLDKEMIPKISDFGMARIFSNDQTEAKTVRVVGTYGYMSPEYALDGLFSIKSDVFSFGVLVLEIVSGKKNRGFFYLDELNLLGHSWRLWNEGRALELVDPSFGNSYSSSEVLICIKVSLICVQERPQDRPTMSSVVLMLSSENASIPHPKKPGFAARTNANTDSPIQQEESYSANKVIVTGVDAR